MHIDGKSVEQRAHRPKHLCFVCACVFAHVHTHTAHLHSHALHMGEGARMEHYLDLRCTRCMFPLYLVALSLSIEELRAAFLEAITLFLKLLLERGDLHILVLDAGICMHQLILHRTECSLLHTSRAQR